jgi:hypothetical protein
VLIMSPFLETITSAIVSTPNDKILTLAQFFGKSVPY